MGKEFRKKNSSLLEDRYRYNEISKETMEVAPPSLLSYDDRDCTLEIVDLIEIVIVDGDNKKSYPAFLCNDVRITYVCHLPVFYVRKVFRGRSIDGEITAGKCTGSFVNALEDGNYSWETVSGMKDRFIHVSNVVKIITDRDNRTVVHRVYTIDLVE